MTPMGGFYSLAPAPVPTRNRFEALTDRVVLDSEGAQIFRDGIVSLSSLVKTKNPNKKRRGKAALSRTSTSASGTSGKYMSAPCQNSSSANPFESPSSSLTAPCTSPTPCSSSLQTLRRPCYSGQGCQHPGHGQPLKPHSGSRFCSHFHGDCCSQLHNSSVDFIDNTNQNTQLMFDDFFRNSQKEIGGIDGFLENGVGVGGLTGVGGHGPGGSKGTGGGRGVELNEENGGKV